jgi:hypothetical protein
MKSIKLVSIVFTLLLLAACAQNKEQIELNLIQNLGDSQIIVATTETSSGALISIKDVMEVKLTVTETTENSYTYVADVIRITSRTKMGSEVDSYDSNKEMSQMSTDELDIHNEYKDYLDAEFNVSLDHKGNIVQPFSDMDGNALETDIVDMSNVQLILPASTATVGTKWTGEKLNTFTGQQIKTTYKIKKIEANEVVITSTSIIPALSSLLDENKAYGQYRLNRQTGTLIKGTIKMDLQTGGKVIKTYEVK